jgi:hypothetical protein
LGRVPGFAKIVLAVQAVIIVVLSGWIYKEYVNNPYLQSYLFSLFQGRGSIIAVLGLGGILVTALVGILLKAGNILGEIEDLSQKIDVPIGVIEVPTTLAPMPVLEIADQKPRDEIDVWHGSLRRWRERAARGE